MKTAIIAANLQGRKLAIAGGMPPQQARCADKLAVRHVHVSFKRDKVQ